MKVVYIISIEGYNWKEKVIIALKIKSDIHFETIVFWLKDTHFETERVSISININDCNKLALIKMIANFLKKIKYDCKYKFVFKLFQK